MTIATPTTPDLRTLQLDPQSLGAIAASVNQFRGDLNLSLPLARLSTGRGPNLDVALFYGSNVGNVVDRWAGTNPTGATGLGWTLPIDQIQLVAAPDALVNPTYTLVQNTVPTPLVRTDDAWQRARIAGALAASLPQTPAAPVALPPAVIAALADAGVLASAAATVAANPATPTTWTVSDPDAQVVWTLATSGQELAVLDGGQGFQLVAYKFWQIRYYPTFERWAITDDAGNTTSFGGAADPRSVAWSVRWGARSAWSGPSAQTKDQVRYARGWLKSSIATPYGETTRFRYNGGLDALTTQAVGGADGRAYTKASYLTEIEDAYGRTIRFSYAAKIFDETKGGAREYLDPHRALDRVPATTPNAYQDAFETLYLTEVATCDEQGVVLNRAALAYDVLAPVGPSFVAGELAYSFGYQRVLTSVTYVNASGGALPPVELTYWRDDKDPKGQPGALRSITYPAGAVVEYDYARTDLTLCQRAAEVSAAIDGATPMVFAGPDYVVAIWQSQTGQLSATVYTWNGRWIAQPLDLPATGVSLAPVGSTGPGVQTQADLFVLPLLSSDVIELYAFHKDPRRTGAWIAPTVDGTAGPITLSTAPPDLLLAAGDGFFAWTDTTTTQVTSITWRWQSQQWVTQPAMDLGGQVSMVGVGAALAALAFPTSGGAVASVSYLDPLGSWHAVASSHTFSTLSAGLTAPLWTAGGASATATWGNTSGGSTIGALVILTWDADFQLVDDKRLPVHRDVDLDYLGDPTAVPAAIVVSDTLVVLGPEAMRFDGVVWHRHRTELFDANVGATTYSAAGADLALFSAVNTETNVARAVVFDPDRGAFVEHALDPQSGLGNPALEYFPTVGTDYATLDQFAYARLSIGSGKWSDAFAAPRKMATGDSTTVLLQDGNYIAYQRPSTAPGQPGTADVLLLWNGATAQRALATETYADAGVSSPGYGSMSYGPNLLITFDASSESFSQASSFTLRRIAGREIDDSLVAWPVTEVRVRDGQRTYRTTYAYGAAQAACDPTGLIVKHFWTSRTQHDDAPAGRVVTTYFNTAQFTGAFDWDLLEGLMVESQSLDAAGQVVYRERTRWRGSATGALPLRIAADGTRATLPLFGGHPHQTRVERTLDGLSSTVQFRYVVPGQAGPMTGAAIASTVTVPGSGGAMQTWRTADRPAAQLDQHDAYRALGMANRLDVIASHTRTVEPLGGAPAIVESHALRVRWFTVPSPTGAAWRVPDHIARYEWRGGDGAPAFVWWTGDEEPPPTWWRPRKVLTRTWRGQVARELAPDGLLTSRIFDRDSRDVVAQFVGADVAAGQASYWGAERYEEAGPWTLPATAKIVDGDAHTGSAAIAVVGAGPSAAFAVATGAPRLRSVFSAWIKASASGAALRGAIVDGSGATVWSSSAAGPSTGRWTQASLVIPLEQIGATGPLTVTVAVDGPAGATILVDDLQLAPVESRPTAVVYDAPFRDAIATVGAGLDVTRTIYDRWRHPIVVVGAEDTAVSLEVPYLAREQAGADLATSPNRSLELRPGTLGFAERFADGDGWTARWAATGAWRREGGALVSSGAASLTASGERAQATSLFVTVTPTAVTGPLGVALAGWVQAAWSPVADGGGAWQLATWSDGAWSVIATAAAGLAAPSAGVAQDLLLSVIAGHLSVFVDGVLVFSQAAPAAAAGPHAPGVFAADPVAVTNPLVADGAGLSARFRSGLGTPIQLQELDPVFGAVAVQWWLDGLARPVVRTKPVPAAFGAAVGVPLLAYQPALVTGFDLSTGQITGAVADYYRGGPDRSDDEGYPFTRSQYEASPVGRLVGVGGAGADLALGSTRGHPSTLQYGPGPAVGSLPAGFYPARTLIDPDGVAHVEVHDLDGRTLATLEQRGDEPGRIVTFDWQFTAEGGAAITVSEPNAFAVPDGTTAADWQQQRLLDLRGAPVSVVDNDAALSQYFYDRAGRTRLITTPPIAAPEAVPAGARYWKYDRLGRTIERGWVATAGVDLATVALDPSWPGAGVEVFDVARMTWDGDGSDPRALGHLVAQETLAAPAVREHLGWNARGEIDRHTLELEDDAVGGRYTSTYTRDLQRRLTRIGYPGLAGAAGPIVEQRYDARGNPIAIAIDGKLALELAHNPLGQVVREVAHTGAGRQVRSMRFNSPSWPRAIESSAYRETIGYLPGEVDAPGAAAFGGTIGQLTHQWGDAALPPEAATYHYDGLHRLHAVETRVATGAVRERLAYDANGNWRAIHDGEHERRARYQPGTDHLIDSGRDGARAAFDAIGRVWSTTASGAAPGVTITRGRASGRPRTLATTDGATVRLAYTPGDRRAWKQVLERTGATATRLYVHGLSDYPLVEIVGAGGRRVAEPRFYDPRGLFAAQGDGHTWWVHRDHQRSTRALVRDDGAVTLPYRYGPWGQLLAGSAQHRPIAYLYTGQELDAETGLYNYRARLYAPALRRFLEIDPVRTPGSPYAYVDNDPISRLDPTGAVSGKAAIGDGTALLAIGIAADLLLSVVSAGTAEFMLLATLGSGLITGAISGAGVNLLTTGIANKNDQISRSEFDRTLLAGAAGGAIAGLASTLNGAIDISVAEGMNGVTIDQAVRALDSVSGVRRNVISAISNALANDAATAIGSGGKAGLREYATASLSGLVAGAVASGTNEGIDAAHDRFLPNAIGPMRAADWSLLRDATARGPAIWGKFLFNVVGLGTAKAFGAVLTMIVAEGISSVVFGDRFGADGLVVTFARNFIGGLVGAGQIPTGATPPPAAPTPATPLIAPPTSP